MISYHIEAVFSDEAKCYFPKAEYKVETRTFDVRENKETRLEFLESLLKESIAHIKARYGGVLSTPIIDLNNFNYANILARSSFTVKLNHHFKLIFSLIEHRDELRNYIKDVLANDYTGVVGYSKYHHIAKKPINYTNSRYEYIKLSDDVELFEGEGSNYHTNLIFLMLLAKYRGAAIKYLQSNSSLLKDSTGIIKLILDLEDNRVPLKESPHHLKVVMDDFLREYQDINNSELRNKTSILDASWEGLRVFFDLYHRKYYAGGKVLGLYSVISVYGDYTLTFSGGTIALNEDVTQIRFIDNLPSPVLGLENEFAELKRLVSNLEANSFSDESFSANIRALDKLTKSIREKHINQAVCRRTRKDIADMYRVAPSTITLMTR